MKHISIPRPDGKILAALFSLILCVEGTQVSYRQIYMKTPDYSLRQIVAAAAENDVDTVSSMVDEKAIANEIFDQLAAKAGGGTTPQPVLQLAWIPLKADFSSSLESLMNEEIAGTTDSAHYEEMKLTVDNRLKAIGFPIPSSGWQYQKASWAHQTGSGKAEMTLTFYNTVLKASIPVTVTMERQSSRVWHITGLVHVDGTIDAIQEAYDRELAAYNEPIQKRIDKTVSVSNVSTNLVRDDDDRMTFLRVHYTPKYAIDADKLSEVKGVYELRRSADGAVLYSSPIRLVLSGSGKDHTTQFLLNPLIPSQYAIMNRSDLKDTKSTVRITELTLDDDSTLTLADKLPE